MRGRDCRPQRGLIGVVVAVVFLWMVPMAHSFFAVLPIVLPPTGSGSIRRTYRPGGGCCRTPKTATLSSDSDQKQTPTASIKIKLQFDNDDALTSFVDSVLLSSSNNKDGTLIREGILNRIYSMNKEDYEMAIKSPLVLEDRTTTVVSTSAGTKPPDCEWLYVPSISDGKTDNNYPLLLRSIQPVLQDVQLIREAAEMVWNCSGEEEDSSSTATQSRFTYQLPGNSEAHVSEFQSASAIHAINRALQTTIYPMIRTNFNVAGTSQLFAYDALVIRYNATAAPGQMAGQPLHRDLGLVSVNILLSNDFDGGGTFLENQLRDEGDPDKTAAGTKTTPRAVHPLGVGRCVAHASWERHAGAGTTRGVRDILVLFVSATDSARLVNARLKQCRQHCEDSATNHEDALLCQIRHHRLAIEMVPDDGEAYQYLGLALMNLAQFYETERSAEKGPEPLQAAVACFRRAITLTPSDSRIYNNLAIALTRQNRGTIDAKMEIEQVYRRGVDLLERSEQAGCQVETDLDSMLLNFGLDLANQDRFDEACDVLARPASKQNSQPSRTSAHAFQLRSFCRKQIASERSGLNIETND
jgi:tetratricopeptide (TPR) repeat protein